MRKVPRSLAFLVVLLAFLAMDAPHALGARAERCRSARANAQTLFLVPAAKLEARSEAAKDLDAFCRAQVKDFNLAALAACIVKGDRVVWSGGYGLADMEKKRPAAADTIFGVGSVSKTVTLAAFMRLWEQGKCSLADDINKYLSFPVRNPRFPDKPVTIRMLLSFTAGIFDVDFAAGKNQLDFLQAPADSATPAAEALREFLVPGGKYYSDKNWLESPPGARYAYSNSSYSLIGCVIERLSGRPFWDYCRRNIFAPLRMSNSSWRLADLNRNRLAYEYEKESGRLKKEEPSTWPGYMDGGLRTTTQDLGNFLIMMMNGGRFEDRQILKPETVDAMLALQNPEGAPQGRSFPTIGRGFVWVLSEIKGCHIFQMNGFGPSFFAQVYFDPVRRIGGAFFTTGGFDSFETLGNAVRMFFDRLLGATDKL